MARFSEMSFGTRLLLLGLIAGIVGAVYYYVLYSPVSQANQELQAKIDDKKKENERLREFEPKLAELTREMAILEQQIEREKKVVPDDKNADQLIRLLHDTGANSGIHIRRYTALPTTNHEFYTDVPFMIDIDGPYYSVLNFFQRVGDLERIVNIENLQMANPKNQGASKVKSTYQYAPGETVVASCTAVTFFSHDPEPVPAGGPPKPGQPTPSPSPAPAAK